MLVRHRNQKTVSVLDVVYVLRQIGTPVYGFGLINKGEHVGNRKAAYRRKLQRNARRIADVELAGAGEEDEEPVISDARLKIFARALGRLTTTPLFEGAKATLNDVLPAINERLEAEHGRRFRGFSREESVAGLRELADENKVMYLDHSEEIFRI